MQSLNKQMSPTPYLIPRKGSEKASTKVLQRINGRHIRKTLMLSISPLSASCWQPKNRVINHEHYNKKWRREQDSNPRYLAAQRFSRPPPSTTRPSLRTDLPLTDGRYEVNSHIGFECVWYPDSSIFELIVLQNGGNGPSHGQAAPIERMAEL